MAGGDGGFLAPTSKALVGEPARSSATCCARGLGSAPFFGFLGGAPHVVVTMMGRTSAEYGAVVLHAVGRLHGRQFRASRGSSVRFGIDALIWWGIGLTIVGCLINVAVYARLPGLGADRDLRAADHHRFGNGLLLPTAIAGAVSVRPQAAGTASGMTGFVQMAIGAAAAQFAGPCDRRRVERAADAAADAVVRRRDRRWRCSPWCGDAPEGDPLRRCRRTWKNVPGIVRRLEQQSLLTR